MIKLKFNIVFIFSISFLFVNAQNNDTTAFSLLNKNKFNEARIIYDSLIKYNKATSLDYFHAAKTYYNIKTTLGHVIENDNGLLLKADSLFSVFLQRQPKSINGYMWRGRVNFFLDSTFEKGLANQFYESAFEIAKKDTVKYTKELLEICNYFFYYYLYKLFFITGKQPIEEWIELDYYFTSYYSSIVKFYRDKIQCNPITQEKELRKIKAE